MAKQLKCSVVLINELYSSSAHGSKDISNILNEKNKSKWIKMISDLEDESEYDNYNIIKAQLKNEELIKDLNNLRKDMLGIGTNKIKRRLNKLSIKDSIAAAARLALEIEDKNICAKKYSSTAYYNNKYNLIIKLISLFKDNKWVYGKEKCNSIETDYILYFEIPGCEQISWHTNLLNIKEIPDYCGKWDKKVNSTLNKLSDFIKKEYSFIL